jgi:uncharacterized membrane protein YdjX (TVP38/TMEM64 family)
MILFLLFLAAALSVVYLTDLHRLITVRALRGYLARFGAWAYVAYVFIFALLVALGFPSSILTVTGAIVFGTLLNTLLTVIAATAGACGSFLVARHLGREWVETRLKGRAAEIDRRLARRGVLTILILRMVPLVPFNAVSFGSGLTGIRFGSYTWATAVGTAPGMFAYSYVTNRAIEVDLSHPETLLEPGMLAAMALVFFLSVLVPLAWRWYERRRDQEGS